MEEQRGGAPAHRPSRRFAAPRAAHAVLGLVAARARRRRSAAALVALSVAGSVVVLGSLLGVGIVTEDLATRRALTELRPPERLIGLHRYTQDGFLSADDDAVARTALQPVLPVTEDILAVRMYQPPREPFRILFMDGLSSWMEVTEGRLPKPCAGGAGVSCEAIRVGLELPSREGEVGSSVELEGVRFDIVGVAVASADLPLDAIRPDGLALFVDGLARYQEPKALNNTPRTGFWLAPLRPDALHSWTLADLDQRVDAVGREMGTLGRSFLLDTPQATLDTVHRKTEIAIGRLVFISSLIVGVLLAFAVFAAAIERSDISMEDRRLRAAGAGTGTRLLFVVGEAFVPAIAGALLGVAGAVATIAWIATQQGAPADIVLGLALLQPASMVLIAGLVALAMAAIVLGIHPAAGRLLQPRIVAAAVVPAAAILVWQRLSARPGRSGPARRRRNLADVGAAAWRARADGDPRLARAAAAVAARPRTGHPAGTDRHPAGRDLRRARAAPAGRDHDPARIQRRRGRVRAGVRGDAPARRRRPGRLRHRHGHQGPEPCLGGAVRAVRGAAAGAGPGREGRRGPADGPQAGRDRIASAVHPRLASTPPPSAASRAGARTSRRRRRPRSATRSTSTAPGRCRRSLSRPGRHAITIDVEYAGDAINLAAVVEADDGSVDHVPFGELTGAPDDDGAARRVRGQALADPRAARLERRRRGRRRPEAGPATDRRRDDPRAGSAAGSRRPCISAASGAGDQLIRPPLPTDDLVFPALVSPDLASDLNADGTIDVLVGAGLPLRIHPVGTTTSMPSITDPDSLVIVDLPPLLLAMDGHDPGTGRPNQVLLEHRATSGPPRWSRRSGRIRSRRS